MTTETETDQDNILTRWNREPDTYLRDVVEPLVERAHSELQRFRGPIRRTVLAVQNPHFDLHPEWIDDLVMDEAVFRATASLCGAGDEVNTLLSQVYTASPTAGSVVLLAQLHPAVEALRHLQLDVLIGLRKRLEGRSGA